MPVEPPKNPAHYSESREEAKNPGALLGMIMGIYPAIFIVGLLVAIGFLSFRNMSTPTYPESKSSESDPSEKMKPSSPNNEKESNSPR